MKLLFLDIDGVLATQKTYRDVRPSGALITGHHELLLCERRIGLLRSFLTSHPDIDVVISSSWRRLFPWERLLQMLEMRGFPVNRITGKTPVSEAEYRGSEIETYLKEYSGASIAILDDDADMKPFMSRLVQTSFTTGLEEKHLSRVTKLLKSP